MLYYWKYLLFNFSSFLSGESLGFIVIVLVFDMFKDNLFALNHRSSVFKSVCNM